MPLNLIAPGTRKGNRFYLARGSVAGRVYEFNTYTTDEKAARRRARELEACIKAEPIPANRITFAEAARRYVEFRNPSRRDRQLIDRIVQILGRRSVHDIRAGDLHEIAVRLYPREGTASTATRNREVLRPAVTILHHAAQAGLCNWIRIRSFPESRPRTRALDPGAAAALIGAATPGAQRLLLTWLFFQGTRITATLKLDWSQIDLVRKNVRLWNGKGDRFEEFPLHEATITELEQVRFEDRIGAVFPWSNKSSLRRWLPPLCARVGVNFTPHMARHTLGTQLAASGASLATIMKALGHSQAASSLRYQSPDIEIVRAAAAKVDYRIKPVLKAVR